MCTYFDKLELNFSFVPNLKKLASTVEQTWGYNFSIKGKRKKKIPVCQTRCTTFHYILKVIKENVLKTKKILSLSNFFYFSNFQLHLLQNQLSALAIQHPAVTMPNAQSSAEPPHANVCPDFSAIHTSPADLNASSTLIVPQAWLASMPSVKILVPELAESTPSAMCWIMFQSALAFKDTLEMHPENVICLPVSFFKYLMSTYNNSRLIQRKQ